MCGSHPHIARVQWSDHEFWDANRSGCAGSSLKEVMHHLANTARTSWIVLLSLRIGLALARLQHSRPEIWVRLEFNGTQFLCWCLQNVNVTRWSRSLLLFSVPPSISPTKFQGWAIHCIHLLEVWERAYFFPRWQAHLPLQPCVQDFFKF